MNALDLDAGGTRPNPSRSRNRQVRMRRNGRTLGSEPLRPGISAPLHLPDTLLAAAGQRAPGSSGQLSIAPQDLRLAVRAVPQHRLIVFAVDASDSMGEGTTTARIAVAKGAVLALLNRAYIHRDRVSMVIFQDDRASLVLPPTGSIDLARKQLRRVPVGGSTPMAKGLLACWDVVRRERQTDPSGNPLLVLISDGEANTPINKAIAPDREVLEIARKIADDRIPAIIIETGTTKANRLMQQIAETFRTRCYRPTDLKVSRVVEMVGETE